MRPRPVLAALTAGLLASALAACGGGEAKGEETPAPEAPAEKADAPADTAPAAAPGPPPEEGYDWSSSQEEIDGAPQLVLAYALSESDDLPVIFLCPPGSGQVTADIQASVTGVGAVIIRSGDTEAMYPVDARTFSEMTGGDMLTVRLPVTDPVLQAFRTNGWLNLAVAGVPRDMAAHPGPGLAAISSFFEGCAVSEASPETPSETSSSAPEAAEPG